MATRSVPRSPEEETARQEARRRYNQAYYRRNRAQILAQVKEYAQGLPPDVAEQRKERKNAVHRARYAAHRETILAQQRLSYAKNKATKTAYAQRHAERKRAYNKAYGIKNRETLRAKARQYAAEHREERRAYNQAYYLRNQTALQQAQLERDAHRRDAIRLYQQAYRRENPDKVRELSQLKRARKQQAPINDFTAAQWRALLKAVGYRCAYCGERFAAKALQQDHITPLAKGGSHTLSNIIPACGPCNNRKNTRAVPRPVQPFLLVD